MRQAFDKGNRRLTNFVKRRYNGVLLNEFSVVGALEKIGEWYTGQVKSIFLHGNFEANSHITMARKRSKRPLVDTGRLRQSISWEVKT